MTDPRITPFPETAMKKGSAPQKKSAQKKTARKKSRPKVTVPKFDPIEEVVAEIRAGNMVVVTDDADRENEGDLIMAAEKVTADALNFIGTYGRGNICVPITRERCAELDLPPMVQQNREQHQTDFTVTVDSAVGITTGISMEERARTIRDLANPDKKSRDFVQPGHVNPLRAKPGGVLQRAGHTEAAVDLARMAGLQSAGVICEILNPDGSVSRLPDLMKFKRKHRLKICSIHDLIEYRRTREKLVHREETILMPTDYGDFELHLYKSLLDGQHHLALTRGKISKNRPTLIRVHSECLTGDVFGSRRCDCGNQLHAALKQIDEAGEGVLIYMRQEGRGIGLASKIHAYKLQEQGLDTVEANERLGFGADLREYGLGAQILLDLGVRKFRLMTNNPKKVVGLGGYGMELVEQVPIKADPNPHNIRYLSTKKSKLGHLL